MVTPTMGATSLTSIVVDWIALTGNDPRGSAIDKYELSYGTTTGGSTFPSVNELTLLTYTLSGATPGEWYRFRVRAHNVHGWGPYSPVLTA